MKINARFGPYGVGFDIPAMSHSINTQHQVAISWDKHPVELRKLQPSLGQGDLVVFLAVLSKESKPQPS